MHRIFTTAFSWLWFVLVSLPLRLVAAVHHYTIYQAYLFYCLSLRPFPIPGGPLVVANSIFDQSMDVDEGGSGEARKEKCASHHHSRPPAPLFTVLPVERSCGGGGGPPTSEDDDEADVLDDFFGAVAANDDGGCGCTAEGNSRSVGDTRPSSSSSSSIAPKRPLISSRTLLAHSVGASLFSIQNILDNGCDGGGNLQTLLDGSRLAHNTHLTCVRNCIPKPAAVTSGGRDAGGNSDGFFLVSEEEAAAEEESKKKALTLAGRNEQKKTNNVNSTNKTEQQKGILFESLEDAILHAHRTATLLVVYLHAEENAASRALLREVIVHNTSSIQRYLSNNVCFYLLSAHDEAARGLVGTVAMGHAFPCILVFNVNQPSNAIGSGESTSRSGIRFVSSMEGCGCVGDLLPYLRECEKRYMSWM